jgi:hypothetical protein
MRLYRKIDDPPMLTLLAAPNSLRRLIFHRFFDSVERAVAGAKMPAA